MKRFFRSLLLILLTCGFRVPVFSLPANSVSESEHVRLNVVFHGLFSYIIWPDHLEVLAPQVDEHVYKAGNWGKEFRLKESVVYHLLGVRGQTHAPDIDVRNNVVLTKISNLDRSQAKVFCSFILPLPERLIGLRRASPPPGQQGFEGTALTGKGPSTIPLVEAITYQIDDLNQLGLSDNLAWVPEVNASKAVNLHIWAEPEVAMGNNVQSSHASQAFSHLMALFPNIDLKLAFNASASPDKSTGIDGLNGWEENSLVERSELLFPKTSGRKQSKRGTEVSNCIGVIVLNNTP